MTPTNVILDRLAEILATDADTLAPVADELHVHLFTNGLTPNPGMVIGDFTLATFDGSTPLEAGVGPQQNFYDPVTGRRTVQLIEPLGGWHWVTTGVTALPQDIYGYVVTDNTDAIVYGAARFDNPVNLTASGQGLDIPEIRFELIPPVLG